ncbi:transposase [Thermobifida halotolerans]|uniref:transposase n=1 Tax=Thermobifida halotolerans TaxID=483545 RepID=UPI003C76AB25
MDRRRRRVRARGSGPPGARTWSRRGHTPVSAVPAQQGRVTAAPACHRGGCVSRLFSRTRVEHQKSGENASFTEADSIALLDAAHRRLGGPIVLVWDNLNRHTSAAMRRRLCGRDRLSVVRLPAHSPGLNPVEGVGAVLKRGLGNLAVAHIDQLAELVARRLAPMRYRPALIDGFLAGAGLTLEP